MDRLYKCTETESPLSGLEVYGHAQQSASPSASELADSQPQPCIVDISDGEGEGSDQELEQIKVPVEDAKKRLHQLHMQNSP